MAAVLVLALAAGAGVYWFTRKADDPVATQPVVLQDFIVTASAAPAGTVGLGTRINVGAQLGSAAGIAAVELWDGSTLVTSDARSAGKKVVGATLAWVADRIGPHVLYVKGTDKGGRVAMSGAMPIEVVELRGGGQKVKVEPQDSGSSANPPPTATTTTSISSDALVAAAQQAAGLPSTPQPATEPTTPAPPKPGPLDGDAIVLDQPLNTHGGVQVPEPKVTVEGCSITVDRRVAERFAHVGPGQLGFTEVAKNHTGKVEFKKLAPGAHVLIGLTGSGVSAPVSFTVPVKCTTGWEGDTTLIGGILTLPKQPTGGIYLYLKEGDKDWQRVPADPKRFLTVTGRRIDLSKELGHVPQGKITLEVWQQIGTVAELIGRGTGTSGIGEANGVPIFEDDPTLEVLPADGQSLDNPNGADIRMTWKAGSPRVKAVLWQVLSIPLSKNNHDVSPFGLVAKGISDGGGRTQGTFTIKSRDLPLPGKLTAAGTIDPDSLALAADRRVEMDGNGTIVIPGGSGTLWIRAIALTRPVQDPAHPNPSLPQFVPMPVTSSAVAVSLVAGLASTTLPFVVTQMDVKAGVGADPNYVGCVRVTKVPPGWTSYQPTAEDLSPMSPSPGRILYLMHRSYPDVGVYCYVPPPPESCGDWLSCAIDTVADGLEAVGDALAEAWDEVAAAYNGLVDYAVDITSSLDPVCRILQAANSPLQSQCESMSHVAAEVSVTAVLALYGLPPSLPTSGDLLAMAQGDLEAWAMAAMKELGVPCDSLQVDATVASIVNSTGAAIPTLPDGSMNACSAAVVSLIDQLKEEVKNRTGALLSSAIGLVYTPVEGFELIPEPAGRAQAPKVQIKGYIEGDATTTPADPAAAIPYQYSTVVSFSLPGLTIFDQGVIITIDETELKPDTRAPWASGVLVLSKDAEQRTPGKTTYTGYRTFPATRGGMEPVALEGWILQAEARPHLGFDALLSGKLPTMTGQLTAQDVYVPADYLLHD